VLTGRNSDEGTCPHRSPALGGRCDPWSVRIDARGDPSAASRELSDAEALRAVAAAEDALGLVDDVVADGGSVVRDGEKVSVNGSSVTMGEVGTAPAGTAPLYASDQLDDTTTRLSAVMTSAQTAAPAWTFEEGTELSVLPDGRVSVAEADGDLLAGVARPWAVDANGRRLPTSYSASGNVLTQHVEVDSSTAFPVIADPTFTVFPGYWTATLNRSESAAAVGTVGSCAAVFSKSPVPALRALTIACGALAAFSAAQLAGGKCIKIHVAGLPPFVGTWWPTFPKC